MTSSSSKIVFFPKPKIARAAHELAFLPSALEIVETPPSPLGRATGATVIAVFCFALLWAIFGVVDIVATASGHIVPQGRTKLIQPFETGVVSAIHVRDGQRVRAGDALIDLDPTMTSAEHANIRSNLQAAELDVARLRAVLAWYETPLRDVTPEFRPSKDGASAEQIDTQRQLFASQVAEHKARLAEFERQLEQKEAERKTVAASIAKLEATIPVLEERVDVRKGLSDKKLGSRLVYLTEYQDLVAMKQDLSVQQSRLHEAAAAGAALRETLERTRAEQRRAVLGDLTKAEQHAAALTQDSIKAARRIGLQRLTAPIDGVVQQLAVHTVGGVVTPAQQLAVVVPNGINIEIEAALSNSDVGFVHVGQIVAIKVETFNFTRYGLIPGVVTNVSRDAVAQPTPKRSNEGGSADAARGGDSKSDLYVVHISLDQKGMDVDGKWMNLSPGMNVSVEIKTGSRRIISYLMSPLEKSRQGALKER